MTGDIYIASTDKDHSWSDQISLSSVVCRTDSEALYTLELLVFHHVHDPLNEDPPQKGLRRMVSKGGPIFYGSGGRIWSQAIQAPLISL